MRENLDKSSLEISEALPAFYVPYASYVIQTRALPDVKDGLKAGARFILYAQYKEKITYENKRRKGTATKSAAMMFSPHGDQAIYANAVRMSQDFSLRYPLIDAHGNNGSLMHNGDYASDRYLEMRSGKIASEMTKLLPKETVDKWKMNYTGEEEYPTYLPSTFPNLLVNGNYGIGVSLSSSIPTHNLNDVSEALITLINKPQASFEELYCPIDFPTGGIIINENEVKESLRIGHGKAATVRAVVDYDSDNNELIVRELPYMVFSANATQSIQEAIDEGLLTGIQSVFDGTDYDGVKIVIKLQKGANVERLLKILYKHTLLQSSFSINMNALDENSRPRMFGWVELLQAFINHLKNIIRKSYLYDIKKLKARIHILEGLITAILHIEEVVELIKNSSTGLAAREGLCNKFGFTIEQADAILALKLSRLANLELQKLEKEKKEKEDERDRLQNILDNENLFNTEVINEIRRIQKEYGDNRKTKNINLDFSSEEDAEPIEEKQLLIYYTNLGNFYTQETTTLLRTRRGTKGSKLKLAANEVIEKVISDTNLSSLMVFTNKGQMYHLSINELPINEKININALFNFGKDERPTTLTSFDPTCKAQYYIFLTKNGLIKKTKASEYNIRRGKSMKAINLKDDDEVINVLFGSTEKVGILTSSGNYVIIDIEDVSATARASMGVKAVKLTGKDIIIDAKLVKPQDKYLLTLSQSGLIKKAEISEFPVCSRATKGKQISGIKENDTILKFLTFAADCDIIIISKRKIVKISTNELHPLSRAAVGVKAIDLAAGDIAQDMQVNIDE